MSKMESDQIEAALAEQKNLTRRKRLFAALGGTVLAAGLAYGAYSHLYLSRFVSTDNAYTAAETAQVTPSVSGIVRELRVVDTQRVSQGDVVAVLDDTDARLALDQAEAELGRAIRKVRGYAATDRSLAAQIASAESDFERARIDIERREALAASGSVSGDEITRARNAFESARAHHAAAIASRAANAVLIADATEQTNPEVALARAKRDQAAVNLERTVIRAPVDGVIAKRAAQVGQQVQAGMPLLSVVPLSQLHVDANFKEGQLEKVRVGQKVEVRSDLYGRHATYHGVIEGLSGGTGATFATIPAQNATGNWIKVVQRVPVRIRLDPKELADRPLQVGLSMVATVDTQSGT